MPPRKCTVARKKPAERQSTLELGLRQIDLAAVGMNPGGADAEEEPALTGTRPRVSANSKVSPGEPVHVSEGFLLTDGLDNAGDRDVPIWVRRIDDADSNVCGAPHVQRFDASRASIHEDHPFVEVDPDRGQVGRAVAAQGRQRTDRFTAEEVLEPARDRSGYQVGGGHGKSLAQQD